MIVFVTEHFSRHTRPDSRILSHHRTFRKYTLKKTREVGWLQWGVHSILPYSPQYTTANCHDFYEFLQNLQYKRFNAYKKISD